MPVRKIHQFFFQFEPLRTLEDYPIFVQSRKLWRGMGGWSYTLWDEALVEALVRKHCPDMLETYSSLRYPIQRVDLAKYLVAHHVGGVVVDLDVLPKCNVDDIIGDKPFVLDRCSRKHVIANDFFYVAEPGGLPNLNDFFVENLARVNSIKVYEQRKMRYVFQSCGPDFWSRYLKRVGLDGFVVALSDRIFADPKQAFRNIYAEDPKLEVKHQLSWVPQLHSTSKV